MTVFYWLSKCKSVKQFLNLNENIKFTNSILFYLKCLIFLIFI